MSQELKTQRIKISYEMETNLMLIHSYLLVKNLIRRGNDKQAARMLIRVAGNISKFPAHTVQILTSAVIQCSKAGLRLSAFNFAVVLMRPENKDKIDKKYRTKIEQVVRKPGKTEEPESESPCLFCAQPLADSELVCPACNGALPYCIATGKHMTKDDFCVCPNCKFPALCSEFRQLTKDEPCPMCNTRVNAETVERTDAEIYLNQSVID